MGIGEMQHPFPEARHFFRRKSFTSGHKVDFLSKKFLRADNGDERHTRKDGSEYERECISKKGGGRAAVKLVFTTVYSSSAAPSFAVRQNLLAALLMRKRREKWFYNRLFFYLCPQLCLRQTCINHLAKIGRKSRFVGRMGSGKISFTTVYSSTSTPNFACGKLV